MQSYNGLADLGVAKGGGNWVMFMLGSTYRWQYSFACFQAF